MRLHEAGRALHLWNRGHWRDYVFSQLMLLAASLFLVFFVAIGLGVDRTLQRFLSNDLPAEQVRVSPPGMQAGFFQTELGGLEITDSLEAAIEELPQVASIDPQVYAHVPAYLEGLLGGQPYYTDITLEGVTGSFLGDSVLRNVDWSYTFEDSASKRLPIVLSENLLVLYNAGFAEANSLLGLTPEGVVGLDCEVTVGRSSIASFPHRPETVRARIVATSRNLSLFALAVPIEFVDQVNSIWRPDRPRAYSALVVTAGKAEDVPDIVRHVEHMGLRAETRRGIAQRAEVLVGVVTAALSALALAILVSAVSSAIHTLIADLRNRKYAIGVLVALGTPEERLALVFSFQILLMSAASLLLGGALGCLLAYGASEALLSLSTALRAAIDTLAVFPVGWMLLGLAAVLAVSTAIAYSFFRKLLRTPVAELLRR